MVSNALSIGLLSGVAGCSDDPPRTAPGAAPPTRAVDYATPPAAPPAFADVPRPPDPRVPRQPVDDRLRIAKELMRGERFGPAELALRTLQRERPADAQVEFFLGVAVQKQKRYSDAKPHFERVIAARQSFPEVDYVFHFLGWCHYYLGELPQSRAAFEEHLRRVPAEADSVFGLGVVAYDDDRVDDAEAHFRAAIGMQADDPKAAREVAKAHARLGDVLVRLDRIDEAERELRAAVRLHPDHYEAWAKLARVLDRLGRPEEAKAARAEDEARRARSLGR